MFQDYVERCDRKEVKPGVHIFTRLYSPPQIINFPTKDHWKSVSRLADIERGLQILVTHYKDWGVSSIAIPPFGCGNGQLEWKAVGPLIYRYARQMDIPIELYAPYGASPRELTIEFLSQTSRGSDHNNGKTVQSAINPAWVALWRSSNESKLSPTTGPLGERFFRSWHTSRPGRVTDRIRLSEG